MGAKVVMLYRSYLMGEGARADHLNVGVAGKGVHKDTGAKVVHRAPNTTSNILAKSISKDGGIMGYRGLVHMGPNSQGSKARVQCDGLMMDGISRSDTWPDIQIENPHVTVAHEGDRRADLRRPALLHGHPRLQRGRGSRDDRQRFHRAGHEGAPDGVRGRAQPFDPARDDRFDRLAARPVGGAACAAVARATGLLAGRGARLVWVVGWVVASGLRAGDLDERARGRWGQQDGDQLALERAGDGTVELRVSGYADGMGALPLHVQGRERRRQSLCREDRGLGTEIAGVEAAASVGAAKALR